MKWEFAALGAGIVGLVLGLSLGSKSHSQPAPPPPLLPYRPTTVAPKAASAEQPPPDYPKPPLEKPTAIADATSVPVPIAGNVADLPLPNPSAGTIDMGSVPLTPTLPGGAPPAADLNADVALAKRIVLGTGATVISVADARDDAGTIGRTLVAETSPTALSGLRMALRKALGARAVISDAGAVSTDDDPGLGKLQNDLDVARKKRDRDRIDFLPESPTLRDSEEAVLGLEREIAERRKAASRVRLSVLLRPAL